MNNKQFEVLKWASSFLEENNRETRVAEILLQYHLNLPREEFIMNMREAISEEVMNAFRTDVEEHVKTGIPIQHLMGYEEFYGRKFKVNEHVLIPRPETEELIQRTLETIRRGKMKNPRIVDVGTGSGIIAITLALELPEAKVIATDISEEALRVAEENANNLRAPVTFMQGNFLDPLIYQQETVDIIVSNPPYIAESEKEEMSDTVKNFDPKLALFAEDEGLAAYKEIINQAPSILGENAMFAFEIGYTQGKQVQSLIEKSFPQKTVDIFKDINGKERIVLAR